MQNENPHYRQQRPTPKGHRPSKEDLDYIRMHYPPETFPVIAALFLEIEHLQQTVRRLIEVRL